MPEPAEEKVAQLEAELAQLRPLKDDSVAKQAEFAEKERAWAKEKADLEQAANPNWRKAREHIEKLKAVALEKGVKLDTEGMPISDEKVDRDAIVREAQEKATNATKQEFLNNRLDELLEDFSTEDAKVVRNLYAKVTNGEEITMQNIRGFVTQAVNAAGFEKPNPLNRALTIRGGSPRQVKDDAPLSDEQADTLSQLMHLKVKPKKK